MAWDTCNVFLNSDSNRVFYAGDIITGSVALVFNNKQHIKQIDCRVMGVCRASWTRPSPTIPYIKHYSEKRKLLDLPIDIFEHYTDKTVSPGIECLNFHFSLPTGLPCSFEDSIAKVEYYVKIQCKAKYKCKVTKITDFIVHNKLNLNHLEEYVTPTFFEIHKQLRSSGRFAISLKTYKGFAPNQVVPFEVCICNEDEVKIKRIKIDLIQKIHYSVSAGYADEQSKICKAEYKSLSNEVKELCHFSMEIPQILPSSSHLVNPMVEIGYFFRLEVNFAYHLTRFEDIPVTVASVPVMHYDYDISYGSPEFLNDNKLF